MRSVRIVHTSDWHIGRRFEREPLDADQRAFLAWLAAQVAAHQVDLVVVAGDVYDRALPGEEAVALLDEGLEALCHAGAAVALISGNHDSARRLGFGARRQAQAGVHVFADVAAPPQPWLFEAGGEAVAVVAVPYLDPLTAPVLVPVAGGAARARSHEQVLTDALAAAPPARARFPGVPSLAVAHATVAGSIRSDSEKVLAIGGADAVPAACFDGFDAVALGHLHRPQRVGAEGRIAYSGSPLPYSFSETHPKSVRLIELVNGAVTSDRELPVPVGRPVVTLEGPLDALLTDPAHDRYVDHWVAARLTDTATQVQPMERLRHRFPRAVNVSYALPSWSSRDVATTGAAAFPGRWTCGGDTGERHVEEAVLAFLAEVTGHAPEGWERELALEGVAAARRGEAS